MIPLFSEKKIPFNANKGVESSYRWKKIKKQFCRIKEAKPNLTSQTPRKNTFKSCEFIKDERQTHKINVLKKKEKENGLPYFQ